LPPLPVRARDLLLLLVLGVAAFLVPPGVVVLLWGEDAIAGLLPVLGLLVTQSLLLFAMAWLAVLRPHRLTLADVGLRPTYSSWYRLAVAGGLLCVPLASLINFVFQSLLGGPFENPQLGALAPDGFSWTSLIAMLLLVGALVPFIEEIIFRGLVFGWLRKHLRFALAAPIVALLFAVAHQVWVLVPVLFFMGLVLAAATERSGSLWPPIILHGTFNSMMTITYYIALAAGE
jgi:membrane protease YdiL (CAAX protease family)